MMELQKRLPKFLFQKKTSSGSEQRVSPFYNKFLPIITKVFINNCFASKGVDMSKMAGRIEI